VEGIGTGTSDSREGRESRTGEAVAIRPVGHGIFIAGKARHPAPALVKR